LHQLVLEGRTKKSMELPGGTVKIRKRQPAIQFEDREAVIEFLRHANPDLIRTKEDVNLAEFRKHIDVHGSTVVLADTGEVLENVLVEEQDDSLSFTPAEENA
jgi:phage host-nuclease inhibitor protein Gam